MGGVKAPVRHLCPEKLVWRGVTLNGTVPEDITLTSKGMLLLIKSGYDVGVSMEKIEDRSKQDTVQKLLVAAQVLWMAVQCAARPLYGLPLSLLEIHTMIQVLCATFLYAFWLKVSVPIINHNGHLGPWVTEKLMSKQKPQDVKEPDVVDPEKWDHLLALMIQATFFSQQNVTLTVLPSEEKEGGKPPATASTDLGQNPKATTWIQPSATGANLRPGEALFSSFQYMDRRKRALELTPTDVLRWTQAFKGLRDVCGCCDTPVRFLDIIPSELRDSVSSGGEMTESLRRFRKVVTSLVESMSVLRRESFVFALLVILSILYGGLHLSAWRNPFPTELECVMWRVSCFVMMGMLPVTVGVCMVCSKVVAKLQVSFESYYKVLKAFEVLSLALLMIYGLARVFVIVEAFISLRRQPIGVYWSPDWLQTVPHF